MELCQIDKYYLYNLNQYNKIVNQRNKLLKDFYPRKAGLADDVEKLYMKISGGRLRQEDSARAARTNFEFEI